MEAIERKVIFIVAVALCTAVRGYTFHRSFKNGYPAEWNVSKDESTDSFSIKNGSVKYTDGRGGVFSHSSVREIVGTVTGVIDGNTIWVRNGKGLRYKVRLRGIVAPGLKQDFGEKSAFRLKVLVDEATVRVEYKGRDQYGRIYGTVWLDGKDINLQMVREGFARASRSDRDSRYAAAESAARVKRAGIWKDASKD